MQSINQKHCEIMLRPRYGIQATGVSGDHYDLPFVSFRDRKTLDWREAPNPFHPVIHYVDAPAGMGKTAMAVDYIKEQLPLMESNFLMAVPSLHLLREIEEPDEVQGHDPGSHRPRRSCSGWNGHRTAHRIL